uniref:Zinc finger domain-containing protein n=1 Tax=Trepomonas sp. PC1 TaxID=1076344 RepID=A0A146KCK9_9EUKA|eukprot:JAP94503.1 Zinc finger domain-containing protein [Trepomonas sp. PC1]
MTFESSESLSSVIHRPVQINKDYKFVSVSIPVPCTICKQKFSCRQEQVDHYHSDEHIRKLHSKCQLQISDIWKKQETVLNDAVINVDLECSKNELSNVSHISEIEFRCETCSQAFKTEGGLIQHLHSKKHRRQANEEQPIVQIVNSQNIEETIE